jgi:hypothetical protein
MDRPSATSQIGGSKGGGSWSPVVLVELSNEVVLVFNEALVKDLGKVQSFEE